jgi:hypothetical protein
LIGVPSDAEPALDGIVERHGRLRECVRVVVVLITERFGCAARKGIASA